MNIFISKNGQQLGPFTLLELNRQRANGQIQDTDMAWHDEIPDWVPVNRLAGLEPLPLIPSGAPVYRPSTVSQVPGQTPVAARVLTALAVFCVSFVFLFFVLFVISCIIFGGIVGAQAAADHHAQGFTEGAQYGQQAGRAFGEKYGLLIMGGSVLVSFLLSILAAWGLSCSNLFPWCRRT